jgi:hypothetical protein
MTDHVVLIANAVASQHIPHHIECHFGFRLPLFHEPSHTKTSLTTNRDFRRHVGEFLLNQVINNRQRRTELLVTQRNPALAYLSAALK